MENSDHLIDLTRYHLRWSRFLRWGSDSAAVRHKRSDPVKSNCWRLGRISQGI